MRFKDLKKSFLLLFLLSFGFGVHSQDSLNHRFDGRIYPQWFSDAKLGIFVHYGLYSIPSYSGKEQYAEWFYKGLISGDSLRIKFQKDVYGEDFEYEDYKDIFKAELFDARQWASLFKRSGAKYVIFTSKHHDGYCMWDSKYAKGWSSATTMPKRDFCRELTDAVREQGLRMGLYYSLTEWNNPLYRWTVDTNKSINEYVTRHLHPQFKELVDEFMPSVIFSDGDWDFDYNAFGSNDLVAYYYDKVGPEAIVNDRWGKGFNHGYKTPEYSGGIEEKTIPWAECRGLSRSFGLNRNVDLESYMSSDELIRHFVRLVAAGGGLTINVGPSADGQIPLLQQERLLDLGHWLEVNGEAVYGSRPHLVNEECYEMVAIRSDKEIDFDWVRNSPARNMPEDDFSISWHTDIVPLKTEKYKIYLQADDNAALVIRDEKGKAVLRLASEKEEVAGQVRLKKNKTYRFELIYQEKDLEAKVRLCWESRSIPKQSIKSDNWKGEMNWEQPYVCFTQNGDNLYAISLERISDNISCGLDRMPSDDMKVFILCRDEVKEIPWQYNPVRRRIKLDTSTISPKDISTKGAWVFRLEDYFRH